MTEHRTCGATCMDNESADLAICENIWNGSDQSPFLAVDLAKKPISLN